MAPTATPVYPQANNTQDTNIATAATNTTVYTAAANGGQVSDILISSNDTANQAAQLFKNTSTIPLASIMIPAGAGTANANNAINILAAVNCLVDEYGNKVLRLKANEILKVAITAITGGKSFQIMAQGVDL